MPYPYSISPLDGNQVLQHAFDDAKQCLRVCIVDGTVGTGGGIEVVIDHTEDSIRLGNGTSFFTSTSENGDVALDVHISNTSLPITLNPIGTPLITRVPIPSADTEYTFTIAAATKKVKFRASKKGKIQYGFAAGSSSLNFYTVDKGDQEEFTDLSLSGSVTVYFRSDVPSEVLEVLEWS